MTTSEFRYRAFISYSHRDERIARWLHRELERYRVPRRLIGRVTEAGAVPRRVAPVFRDREELPSASDLSRVVTAALAESAALLVICSPAAAKSRWVNEEISAFRRLGRPDRIFCVIVDGAPESDGDQQCFPPALRAVASGDDSAAGLEPIAADLRPGKDRQRYALLKLVAGILGVTLEELARRDLQRRNRRLVAITAASVTGMGAAVLLATLALIARNEAQLQRARAEVEATTAQQTSEFLVELFQVVDPSEARGNAVTAREILDRGARRIDSDLAQQPSVRANLLHTMGRVYTGLGLYEPSTDLLGRALDLRRQLNSPATHDAVATENALALSLYLKGDYAAAEAAYQNALRGAEALYPLGDPTVTEAMTGIASVRSQRGDFAGAENEYRAALAIDRRLHGDMHADVARSLFGLGHTLEEEQRFDESESALREALAIRRQVLGDDHPRVAETLNELGTLMYFSGHSDAAEQYFREAVERYRHLLGNDHPEVASILNNLGRVLLERDKLAEAEPLLREALAIDTKLRDANHDDFVFTMNNLALARLGLGELDAAFALLEQARTIATASKHRMLGQVWTNIADFYLRSGRAAEALAAIATARPLLASDTQGPAWYEANAASIEGAAYVRQGDLERAKPLLLESYPVIAARWGERGFFTRMAAERTATLYDARGDSHRAAELRAGAGGQR